MRLIINLMIFAGSALMVYNILRYGLFVRDSQRLEQINRKLGLLVVPLLLLIFFLVGYIVVGQNSRSYDSGDPVRWKCIRVPAFDGDVLHY